MRAGAGRVGTSGAKEKADRTQRHNRADSEDIPDPGVQPAEYFQAVIRLKKLYAMLKKWEAGTLEFTPTSSKEALYGQYALMTGYIRILLDRATEEGIELPRVENV